MDGLLPNKHYELDASILTADRIYELGTPTAVGNRIRLALTNGNASYEAIIQGQGDTGITINGGSAATELTRLFIAREYMEFIATSLTNWDVYADGRISQLVKLPGAAVSNVYVGGSNVKMPLSAATIAVGNSGDDANDQVVVRRTGKYRVTGVAFYAT